ncbi:MAG: hypothetical protein JNM69_08770 [Archangium sp.]|nr:hypothetical protein [Archangium sp.]
MSSSSLINWWNPTPEMAKTADVFADHPLAREAAGKLMARLRTGFITDGYGVELLHKPSGGKMFGVLVVRAPDGAVGVLHGFSGQLGWDWEVPGFVPPLFDLPARLKAEAASDAAVHALTAELEALGNSAAWAYSKRALETFDARVAEEKAALQHELKARQLRRNTARSDGADPKALDLESRADTMLGRERNAVWKRDRLALVAGLEPFERQHATLTATRAQTSRDAMTAIFGTYRMRNRAGVERDLRALFDGAAPPWGTADCAGPKLIGHALSLGLEPIALAEFWWGPPPPAGGRVEGEFYPPCVERCGVVLPFLLSTT